MTKMLGQGRLEAYCMDGKNRQCHIRGKMRKKVRKALREGGRLCSSSPTCLTDIRPSPYVQTTLFFLPAGVGGRWRHCARFAAGVPG